MSISFDFNNTNRRNTDAHSIGLSQTSVAVGSFYINHYETKNQN